MPPSTTITVISEGVTNFFLFSFVSLGFFLFVFVLFVCSFVCVFFEGVGVGVGGLNVIVNREMAEPYFTSEEISCFIFRGRQQWCSGIGGTSIGRTSLAWSICT